jgi:hypothetical protein
MISPVFFEVIRKRLCPELKRYIFQYIDIETRIQMLLEKHPYFATGSNRLPTNDINANNKNPLFSLLTGQQLATIYRKGWLNQLWDLKGSKWYAKPELTRLCPNDILITPLFGNGAINLRVVEDYSYVHSVITTLNKLRHNVKLNSGGFSHGWSTNNQSAIPIAALSLLLNINAFDIDINYYLRKKGFRFLIAMIKLIDRAQYKKDIEREKWQRITTTYGMEREDKLSKAVAKAAKIQAKQDKAAAIKTKKQANRDKAVAIKTKKRATMVAKLEKAIAKKAKRWVVILANQDKAVVQQRRYKLNIIA